MLVMMDVFPTLFASHTASTADALETVFHLLIPSCVTIAGVSGYTFVHYHRRATKTSDFLISIINVTTLGHVNLLLVIDSQFTFFDFQSCHLQELASSLLLRSFLIPLENRSRCFIWTNSNLFTISIKTEVYSSISIFWLLIHLQSLLTVTITTTIMLLLQTSVPLRPINNMNLRKHVHLLILQLDRRLHCSADECFVVLWCKFLPHLFFGVHFFS